MSSYSTYFSPTGGTKKVADILAGALGGLWQEIDLCVETVPVSRPMPCGCHRCRGCTDGGQGQVHQLYL